MHPGSADAPFPERLGRYEVLLPIASGGMATVFLARAMGMGGFEREVALKLTHAHLREKPSFFTSLIDEARLSGRIRHPNVTSVLDVGEDASGVFIVMDYVEGDSLAGVQRSLRRLNARMPFDVALRILDDMLAGLHSAHELKDDLGQPMQLVHRDVTPHNVLVGTDGVTRLTDFGIAKVASRMTKTATGLVKGKLTYMSPEQARGMEIDRTCDIWAAGVVAWELFSGLRLYEGLNDAALLLKIVRDSPTPLRHVRPDVPRELADVVARALTLQPHARFASAEAFAIALSAAARSSGIPIADARGVRSFLEPLVADQLAERRRKVSAILADRGRFSSPELVAPPPAAGVTDSALRTLRAADTLVVQPPTPSSRLAHPVGVTESLEAREGLTAAHGFETPVRSDSASRAAVDPSTILTAPLRSRLWVLIALVPPVLLALVYSLARGSGSGGEPTPAVGLPSAAPIATNPAPPAIAPAPIPNADANTEPEVITPSELELESTERDEPTRPRPTWRGPRPAPNPATPPEQVELPVQPAPLENPYKKR